MRLHWTVLAGGMAGAFALAGCGGDDQQANRIDPRTTVRTSAQTPAAPPAPLPTDGWIGRWIGVEGLSLDIAKTETPGAYRLRMTLMDAKGDYAGTADGEVIRFRRDGRMETIRHTDGAATGLKWLADKKDCLTVKEGVGFCRD